MFEQFSEDARQAVIVAQNSARQLGHPHVSSEHILLGLMQCNKQLLKILTEKGFTVNILLAEIKKIRGLGVKSATGDLRFTPGGQKILEAAVKLASELRHNHVSTAHILLALLDKGEGVGPIIIYGQLKLAKEPKPNQQLTSIRERVIRLFDS